MVLCGVLSTVATAQIASTEPVLIPSTSSGQALSKGSGRAYPSKPVRMVAATTVGSGADVIARLLATRLTERWGQQIVVDNRAGASGLIGAELVARAAPDGHTLWMATMTQLISTTLYQRFLMAKEFAPVGMVASTPFVIAVNASLPVKSIAELITYSKSRPGQMLYGSAGQGTTPHLCMELFKSMTGADLSHVPYKGSVPALTEMMGGLIHASCVAAHSHARIRAKRQGARAGRHYTHGDIARAWRVTYRRDRARL